MLERRKHDRIRSFAACTVADRSRRGALDGVLRDVSEGGARLLLDAPPRAPVELEIALRGGVRPARIVWRSATAVGVAFQAAAPAAPLTAVVVSLDAARRARLGAGARLAERIARFVRPSRRPEPA